VGSTHAPCRSEKGFEPKSLSHVLPTRRSLRLPPPTMTARPHSRPGAHAEERRGGTGGSLLELRAVPVGDAALLAHQPHVVRARPMDPPVRLGAARLWSPPDRAVETHDQRLEAGVAERSADRPYVALGAAPDGEQGAVELLENGGPFERRRCGVDRCVGPTVTRRRVEGTLTSAAASRHSHSFRRRLWHRRQWQVPIRGSLKSIVQSGVISSRTLIGWRLDP